MTTLTLVYCSFCERVNRFFNRLIKMGETAGTYRAAAQLAQLGYHKEAKELMMKLKKV